MKWYTDKRMCVLMVVAVVWAGAPATWAQEDAVPIENLRLPIEHYPDETLLAGIPPG